MGNSVAKICLLPAPPTALRTSLCATQRWLKKSHRRLLHGGDHGRPHEQGLMIRTLDGQDRMLASKTVKSNHFLGKFPVDLNALENVGVPALRLALMTKDMIVIDEVGTLEGMSTRFKETLLECLNSSKPVLATIRSSNNAFTDQLKKLPDTQVILLTKKMPPRCARKFANGWTASLSYPEVVLKPKEEGRLQSGHLWAFSNEIAQGPAASVEPGALVDLYNAKKGFLGRGFYNPHS